MDAPYLIRAKKLVTVSERGSIADGGMLIAQGRIAKIGAWSEIEELHQGKELPLVDCGDRVITPSLVDCHTHLLEFAPASVYPVTEATQGAGGISLLLSALASGITALGEQICGHPNSRCTLRHYRQFAAQVPMDLTFSLSSITIGFARLAHFTAATGSRPVEKEQLLDPHILQTLAADSEYPGENLFLNATPANFTPDQVPRAGEMIYTQAELNRIVDLFHAAGKPIGVHVGGEEGIQQALDAGVDVLHHAHGITERQIAEAAARKVRIVATPLGGTHEPPNSPEQIARLVEAGVPVAISTDAYLPPHPKAFWPPFAKPTKAGRSLLGPDVLMAIAQPSMQLLAERGHTESEILSLITRRGAQILGKEHRYGSLREGLEANFLVATGVPGLEIASVEEIGQVYYRGVKVIDRLSARAGE